MGIVDFQKDAETLERLIRGLNPWPSAYTYLNGKTLKIWKAAVEKSGSEPENPGTIIKADKDGIHVVCGQDILIFRRGTAGRKEAYGRRSFFTRLSRGIGNHAFGS